MKLDSMLVGVSSSPATGELMKALVEAQKGFRPVRRSGVNESEGFRYATYADICEATVPSLLKAGLAQPTFSMGFDKEIRGWVLVGTLCHAASDQWISAVCPLLLGYREGAMPGIQALEIENTYARKILLGNLVGGWVEAEGDDAQSPSPVAAEAAPAEMTPVKQAKPRSKQPAMSAVANDLLRRAGDKLARVKDDKGEVAKVLAYLDTLAQQGKVPSSEVTLLRARYVLNARVTEVIEEAADAD